MIMSATAFISYYAGVRRRTVNYCRQIPPEQIDWAPRPGEFTCGDLVRHIAAAEQMFVGVAAADRWAYPGHERSLASSLDDALAHLEASHTSAVATLGTLSDEELQATRQALDGRPLPVWRVLMLLVEHEVHHRSQLSEYLSALGVTPPQIFGVYVEELIAQIDQRPG
jgi:uncharacterized damage-inducible protein DinB